MVEKDPKFLSKTNFCIKNLELSSYKVYEKIGKGQFSEVYRATRESDGMVVALKTIKISEMTDVKSRNDCMKEIKLLQVIKYAQFFNLDLRTFNFNEFIYFRS